MKSNNAPIGVFDSGVGGLSVLQQAAKILENESFIYFGDTANAPYGNKPEQQIRDLTLSCGEFLYNKGVKAMVIACNTATSAAVWLMREKYNIPIISIEPAVKPAVEAASKDSMVAVMATPATISQKRYRALLDRLNCIDKVINIPCDGLATYVETYAADSPEIEAYIRNKLNPLIDENISGIVVGCTHYSFIAKTIKKIANEMLNGDCKIFDGIYGTSRHIYDVLLENNMLADSGNERYIKFYSSAGDEAAAKMEKMFYSCRAGLE